ncbi:MAG: PorV/PorQ family protein [Ignavibacteriales bacterium]|nr:PorV/PorQ family protein [Ignavibacteriales bacterium]
MNLIKNKNIIIAAVIIQGFLLNVAFGQSKAGTTIGQFLKIEPSSRAASMGNAYTSLSGEASSIFFNPASLGRLTSSDVQFTHNKWIADIFYNYANVSIHINDLGSFALQVTSLNSGEIDVRTVEQPLGTGERYSVTDFAIGLGYGLMLTDRVSVGILINYFQETIWHSSLAGFAMNFGVQYQVAQDGLTLGASVSNFGPRASYNGRDLFINYDFSSGKHGDNDQLPAELRTDSYQLPTLFRAGISYPVSFGKDNKIILAVDAIHPNDNNEYLNVGGEWTFLDNFSVRGGYRELFMQDSEGGLVLGAGIRISPLQGYNLHFDYAWADYGRLNDAHRFSVGFSF